jgi:hypothetical protein
MLERMALAAGFVVGFFHTAWRELVRRCTLRHE